MKKSKHFLKKYWIAIWLIVAVVALSIVVQAEYFAERNRVRRVVANVASEGQLFSSNHLSVGDLELKKIQATPEGGYCVVPINIWNYSPSNPQRAYQADLPYSLTFRLVDSRGQGIAQNTEGASLIQYSTDGNDYNSFTWNAVKGSYYWETGDAFNRQVNGAYVPDYHEYYIRFPESVLTSDPGIYVEAIATPNDRKIFSPINAILGVQPQATTLVRGWTGDFYDNKTYSDYDAFNYVVMGNGQATVTLEWCSDYLEINSVNLSEYNADISSRDLTGTSKTIGNVTGTWKKIVINADADREDGSGNRIGRNRYAFQFYMTGNPSSDYGTVSDATAFWNTVGGYVSFTAE